MCVCVQAKVAPSLVPSFDVTVYVVLNDFGKLGRAYLETNEEKADLETVFAGMLAGEFRRPVRVVAFNTAEGWSRDVSEDVAWEVLKRASSACKALPEAVHQFVVFYVGETAALKAENAILYELASALYGSGVPILSTHPELRLRRAQAQP